VLEFYLWTANEPTYELFNTILPYLGEGASLAGASPVILALIKELELPLTATLKELPYIQGGFSNIFMGTTPNGD